MKLISLKWHGKTYDCARYDRSDTPQVLDVFFFWKTAVLLAEHTKTRNPPLPEKFSAPLCCFLCGLVHKKGAGADAFRVGASDKIQASCEIKGTVTESGFTDVKRSLDFDELYWLSFSDHHTLQFEIYRFTKTQ